MKKTLVVLLAIAMIVSLLASFPFAGWAEETTGAAQTEVDPYPDGEGDAVPTDTWDGTANIKWYLDAIAKDPNAKQFDINTAEDLAGFSYLVNACYLTYEETLDDGTIETRKTAYNGLWYDSTEEHYGDVLGFVAGGESDYRFNYELLKLNIPKVKTEGNAFSFTANDGVYYPKYKSDYQTTDDGSARIAGDNFQYKTVTLRANLIMNADFTAELYRNAEPTDVNVWMPIGGGRNSSATFSTFSGTFEGNGHTISGLYCSGVAAKSSFVALFGNIARDATTTIQNVTLDQCVFKGVYQASALVGRTRGISKLFNCHVLNTIAINTEGDAGGLVGACHGGSITVTQCSVQHCYIEANRAVGGLLGSLNFQGLYVRDCILTDTTVHASTYMTDKNTPTGGWDAGVIVGRVGQGSISVRQTISSVVVILDGAVDSGLGTAYTDSAGVVYGACAKKNTSEESRFKTTVTVDDYYYVDKIQVTDPAKQIVSFPKASKIESDDFLLGGLGFVTLQDSSLDFAKTWIPGEEGEFPALRNAGKFAVDAVQEESAAELDHITQHDYVFEMERKADCNTAGVKAHYECSGCDKKFNENYEEVSDADLVIPASHTLGELVAATDTMKAHYRCSECGQYFDENKTQVKKSDLAVTAKKGCGSAIVSAPLIAGVVFGSALLLKKKENESK